MKLVISSISNSSRNKEYWIKLVTKNTQHEPKDIQFKHVKGFALIKTSIRTISTY